MMLASIWLTFRALGERAGAVEALLAPARKSLRFSDLPDRLQSVRDSLAEIGIGRGDRVVSVLPRGPETAICYLGVAACATYIPLNPDLTEAEFIAHLSKLRPKGLIVPKGYAGAAVRAAQALGIAVIDLVANAAEAAGTFSLAPRSGYPAGNAPCIEDWNTSEDIALVLLTSGSTSEPKAVPLRVRHLLAYAHSAGKHYGLGHGDRCLHVMPMFHGHGLKSSLLVPLANGSGVICSPDFDVPSFFQQMKALCPTWYSAASSIHHAILGRIDEHREIARNAKLRFIRSGSSRLDPKTMAGLEEAFAAPVLERYGMSETGTLTANCLPPGIRKPGTVGRPMGNEVVVLDDDGQVLDSNREGEIVARGPTIFDGYWENQEANAAAFVNGWFRTGDLGRFDDDGFLTVTGRKKDVINRGGEKIATAEIEAALSRHPAVGEVCAFGIPHPSLGEEIAAAVVCRETVTEQELQAHASDILAGVKIPRRIFLLTALPKGASNKISRDKVVEICRDLLGRARNAGAEDAAQLRSPLEQDIAKAWKRILGLESVDSNDNFFLLGGDSLKAYELFAHIRKAFGLTLSLRHIFEDAGTVASMAKLIERARREKSNAAPDGLVAIKAEGQWPPLFAVPGSDGNPVEFIHLGRLLDSRQPLIGIEARGINGEDRPLSRVEDIAADHIEQIRRMQPKGPYYLTGDCFGGRVAYEMARQLELAGESIGLLLLMDPSPPFSNSVGRPRADIASPVEISRSALLIGFIRDRAKLYADSLIKLRGAERRRFVREKLALLRDMIAHRDAFRGNRSELYRRAVYTANRQAGRRYVPAPYHGPAILCFTSDRKIAGVRNYRLDWLERIPQAGEAIFVPGKDSGDMLSLPHVYGLAILVNKCMRERQVLENPEAKTDSREVQNAL